MGVASYGMPSTVVGNTNQDVVQTLALVNMAGDELLREHEWQACSIQYNFSAVYYQYTATVSTASTTISSLSSTTGLTTNPTYFQVTGTGIPQDTFLVSVNAGAQTAVLSRTPEASATGATLTFSQVLFPFPTDFDRPIDRTQWDKSRHWEMLGPKTAQEWEWLKSGYISSGPRIRFRQFGGVFAIWPPLGANENLSYEYQSKYWVLVTSGTQVSKQAFSVDTDTCIFPDAVMRSLIRLKYFEVKGFDTTALYRDYVMQRDLAKAHDKGSPSLSMAPRVNDVLIGWENIPDSGYGQ